MNIQEALLRQNDISFDETVRSIIGQLLILDLGVIRKIYEVDPEGEDFEDGVYADVQLVGGQRLTNIEVCFIGNKNNGIDASAAVGDTVLVFGLRNKVTSIEEMLFEQTEPYGEETCKCITLGKIHSSLCDLVMSSGIFMTHELSQFGIDNAGVIKKKIGDIVNEEEETDGSYIKQYKNLSFKTRNEEGLVEKKLYDTTEAERKELEHTFHDLTGNLEIYRNEITDFATAWADKKWSYYRNRNPAEKTDTIVYKNEDLLILSKTLYNEADGTFTAGLYEQSEDGEDFLVTFTQNPDGSIDRLQTSDGEEAVNHISIDADGTAAIDIADGKIKLVLNSDGTFTWDLEDSFTLTVKGAIDIATEDALNMSSKGAMALGSDDAVTIDSGADMGLTAGGALNMEASTDASLKGGASLKLEGTAGTTLKDAVSIEINGAMVKITGGQLTVNGTAAPTGSGPFCGIPACLFTGAPHVGNMAAGT